MNLTLLVNAVFAVVAIAFAASSSGPTDLIPSTREAIAPTTEYAAFERAL